MDQISKGMVFFGCVLVNALIWAVLLYAKWKHDRKPPKQ